MIGAFDTTSIGAIHHVMHDYYGQRVAAASADNMVYIWDVLDGQQKVTGQLKGHEGPVWKVSWAHPRFGSVVASCSYDMKVIVWKEVNPGNWQIAHMDSSHTASVNDVEFCPAEYGLRLACASADGTVSVLTYDQGQWLRQAFPASTGGSQALSWAPAEKRDVPTMRLVVGGCDNAACVFKCENETWTPEFPQMPAVHEDWVRDVAWRATEGASVVASGSHDKTVAIFSQEMEGQHWRQICKIPVPGKVESLSWCESGSILGISCGDSDVVLYKETYDGRYEQIGKDDESGFVEIPNSMTAALKSQTSAPPPAANQVAPPPSQELQQQTQNVLDSFGIM
jgi:protein transport protein SEC13